MMSRVAAICLQLPGMHVSMVELIALAPPAFLPKSLEGFRLVGRPCSSKFCGSVANCDSSDLNCRFKPV